MKHYLPLLLCWCLGGFLPLGAEEPPPAPNSEPAVEEAAAPVPEAEAAGEDLIEDPLSGVAEGRMS